MKCSGCRFKSTSSFGFDYCLGSPEYETPKYISDLNILNVDRIHVGEDIFEEDDSSLYEVRDEDECVYWASDRFEIKNYACEIKTVLKGMSDAEISRVEEEL